MRLHWQHHPQLNPGTRPAQAKSFRNTSRRTKEPIASYASEHVANSGCNSVVEPVKCPKCPANRQGGDVTRPKEHYRGGHYARTAITSKVHLEWQLSRYTSGLQLTPPSSRTHPHRELTPSSRSSGEIQAAGLQLWVQRPLTHAKIQVGAIAISTGMSSARACSRYLEHIQRG